MDNQVLGRDGHVIGYRCDTCDEVKAKMWGNTCNQCSNELDLKTEIQELRQRIERLEADKDSNNVST
jgi:hypothetical protein